MQNEVAMSVNVLTHRILEKFNTMILPQLNEKLDPFPAVNSRK